MHITFHDVPVVRHLLYFMAICFLKITGWQKSGDLPKHPKYVIIGAPHTSNWDAFYMLFFALAFKVKFSFMIKDFYFKWPLGPIFRFFGGIPIDRSKANNTVDSIINAFNERDEFIVLIPPEGTRKRMERWKTGFYHIAMGADVPIAMAFIDFKQKKAGFMGSFSPTGNIQIDMIDIQRRYLGVSAKYPENVTLDPYFADQQQKENLNGSPDIRTNSQNL